MYKDMLPGEELKVINPDFCMRICFDEEGGSRSERGGAFVGQTFLDVILELLPVHLGIPFYFTNGMGLASPLDQI